MRQSSPVAFIMLLPIIMFVLFSFADMGVNFNIRNQMQTAAEGGARAVAIYGGTNTNVNKTYGNSADIKVTITGELGPDGKVKTDPISGKKLEGLIPYTLMESSLVENIKVECGPDKTYAGQPVYCEIIYTYNGLLSTGGYFNLGGKIVEARGTSVSEVKTINP